MYQLRMMPGQTPYTNQELAKLYTLVSDAADGDPGEQDEAQVPREREESEP